MTEKGQMLRVALVALLLVAVWCGLGARLSILHLGENQGLQSRIRDIREYEQPILVGRGRVLDRNGNILALDLAVGDVCVDPVVIRQNGHTRFISAQLARLLQLDPAMVLARVDRPARRFEYVKRFVKEDTLHEIMNLQMQGVFFDDVSQRNYPHGPLMCHVVGFANQEGRGSAGIELRQDKYLRGVPGLRVSEKDGRKREVYTRRTLEIQPQEGADVHLTLDQNLQYFTERALDSAMEKHHAKGAWAVIEEVRTGRILALASRPAYDLNSYMTAPEDARLDRAIGYVYEPGSTFKIAAIAAALDAGVTTPDVVIDCENGRWSFAGKILRDYHPHGRLTVADVLKVSSNIGAAKIAMMLGEKRFYKALTDFGIGSRTGIDLPGEEAGILPPLKAWSKLSISRIPMGQGVAVTSLQMVNMLCAMGNDGFLMRPQVIDRVVNKEGRIISQSAPYVVGRPLRGETAKLMCQLLTRVTEEGGTGTRARVENYTVAGKTGSAQKAVPGGYSDTAHVASFMGLLPAERPEIGIVVVVDEPQPLHTGGVVSAPVFKEIAEQAVRYLDLAPVASEQMYAYGDKIPGMEM